MPPRGLYLPFFLGSRLVVWLVTFDNMGVRVRETLGTEHFVEIVFPGELVEGRINNTWPGRQSAMFRGDFFLDIISLDCGHPPASNPQNQTPLAR